jgi:AraC family transcriptional regulator, transcriptional activator of pobA
MQALTVPFYSLRPEKPTGNKHFRMYQFQGTMPEQSEMLVPHRNDYYLLVFIRRATGRQWIDMTSYSLKNNTIYFTGPNQMIVKEDLIQVWSTGIAFTKEFLSLQENAVKQLSIIQNLYNEHELSLADEDVVLVEDLLTRIAHEYEQPGEWQHRMLSAYLTVLLTHLSRLYTARFKDSHNPTDQQLLKHFQAKVNDHFQQCHEVSDYASMLNISAGHLSEIVKIQSGKPAIKHIHDRLVMEARRLLFHTGQPLKDIAYELGFAEPSYFNRFFKRETGVTPATYRTQIRELYQ